MLFYDVVLPFLLFHHKIKQKSIKKYSKKSAFYIAQIGKYQAVLSLGVHKNTSIKLKCHFILIETYVFVDMLLSLYLNLN